MLRFWLQPCLRTCLRTGARTGLSVLIFTVSLVVSQPQLANAGALFEGDDGPGEGVMRAHALLGAQAFNQRFTNEWERQSLGATGVYAPLALGLRFGIIAGLDAGLQLSGVYVRDGGFDVSAISLRELRPSLGYTFGFSNHMTLTLRAGAKIDAGRDITGLQLDDVPTTDNQHGVEAQLYWFYRPVDALTLRAGLGFVFNFLTTRTLPDAGATTFQNGALFDPNFTVAWRVTRWLELSVGLGAALRTQSYAGGDAPGYQQPVEGEPGQFTRGGYVADSEVVALYALPAVAFLPIPTQRITIALASAGEDFVRGLVFAGRNETATTFPPVTLTWQGEFSLTKPPPPQKSVADDE